MASPFDGIPVSVTQRYTSGEFKQLIGSIHLPPGVYGLVANMGMMPGAGVATLTVTLEDDPDTNILTLTSSAPPSNVGSFPLTFTLVGVNQGIRIWMKTSNNLGTAVCNGIGIVSL